MMVQTAKATLNPLTTHCNGVGAEPRSLAIPGSATAVPEMDNGITNWANKITASSSRGRGTGTPLVRYKTKVR